MDKAEFPPGRAVLSYGPDTAVIPTSQLTTVWDLLVGLSQGNIAGIAHRLEAGRHVEVQINGTYITTEDQLIRSGDVVEVELAYL